MMLVAEIGQAHEGSLGLCHSYIDALADAGVDAVKFQIHIAEAESSEFEPFRIPFSYEDKTRFDYWKRMEFSEDQWVGLKLHCDRVGVEFMASPFSLAAVTLMEKLDVRRYKIGSGELNNYLMLSKIARTGKPIILSSGMSDWVELERTIAFLQPFGNNLTLLQCTTAYPVPPKDWGLSAIAEMKKRFGLAVGFSDHSATIYAGLAATALGAELIEVHAVYDKKMFGPDSPASLTISEIKSLSEGMKMIRTSLDSNYSKSENESFKTLKIIFGKSLSVNKNMKKGDAISMEDLESKKPGDKGIPAIAFENVIGKKLTRDLCQWSFLTTDDLE